MMKLKPCPFCGGEIERHRDSYYIDHKSSCFLFRNNMNFIEDNGLEAWNRREPIDKIVEQLEELQERHPYKVAGDYDTYSQYNQAWESCSDQAIEIVKSGGKV